MKRICYVGPIANTSATNGGYNNIAKAQVSILNKLPNNEYYVEFYDINSINTNQPNLKSYFDVCIILTHPSSFDSSAFNQYIDLFLRVSKQRLLHIFWETNSLPEKWNTLFKSNRLTGFIASSKFVYNLIEKRKLPYQTNHLWYYQIDNDYPFLKHNIDCDFNKKLNEKTFTVLYVGQYTKRKGLEDAVVSFVQAFHNCHDCKLILKFHKLSNIELNEDELFKSLIMLNSKHMESQIYKITDNLSVESLCELYSDSSLLLFNSRGEGLGLPAIEAGCIGIPVAYTDGSSLPEVCEFDGNYKINSYTELAYGMAPYDYESNTTYSVPTILSTVQQLQKAYDLWKSNRIEYYRTKNNYIKIQEKFSEEISIQQIKKIL